MNAKTYSRIFEPVRIGKVLLRNRIIFPAMDTTYSDENGYVTDRVKGYYEARAMGGAGMVTVEAATIDMKVARSMTCMLSLDDDKFVPGLKELARAIKKHGAVPAIQIFHGGRQDDSNITKTQPVAPSPVRSTSGMMARELTVAEIQGLVAAFAEAVARAKRAGFEGVEIHAAHGVLPSQFLSPLYNQRRDEYGGSIENRARFPLEIVRASRKAVGADYAIWCKINAHEYAERPGLNLDEARKVARMLEQAGIDAVHVSVYAHGGYYWKTTMPDLPGRHIALAEGIKEVVAVPVIAVGRITPEVAEQTLKEGKADLVSMGRALIADPELPNKLRAGREEDIIPCISCHHCLHSMVYGKTGMECAVNPMTGREVQYPIAPARKARRVHVVGGGPAGMEAARVAAIRGHQVVLYEREAQLGGQLVPAAVPPGKDRITPFTQYLAKQLEKLGVQIRLGVEAMPGTLVQDKAEAVIVATGAKMDTPKLEGINRANVVQAIDVLIGKVKTGDKVIVIGGGLVGCETALWLAGQGKKVTVVEVLPNLATRVSPGIRRPLLDELRAHTEVLVGVQCEGITDKGLTLTTTQKERRTIEADTIVLAVGATPNNRLAQELQGKVPEVYQAGDAMEPRQIADAVYDGWRIAREL